MKPRILVSCDFGPASAKALAWAADLQRSLGGPLHVIHVVNPLPAIAVETVLPALTEDEIGAVRASLRDFVAGCGVTATSEVMLAASTSDAILEAASRLDADLIVMGTHGCGGLRRAMLGSVADMVVRTARCPVVTVRAKPADAQPARAA